MIETLHQHRLPTDQRDFVRTFLRLVTVLPRILDQELEERHRISLSEFGVLIIVATHDGNAPTMTEIAAANELSPSGVTRIVTRLERRGFVTRTRLCQDGRHAQVRFTSEGEAAFARFYPDYLAVIDRVLLRHLADLDLPPLTAAFSHVCSPVDEGAR